VTVPAWCLGDTPPGWPITLEVVSGLAVGVPARWRAEPSIEVSESRWAGAMTGELLVVGHLAQADPVTPLEDWSAGAFVMTGLPAPLDPRVTEWSLLEMASIEPSSELAHRYGADEAVSTSGVVFVQSASSTLVRFYDLTLRRGTQAWKVSLGLQSACPPGMPEPFVDANDHRRAAATFGAVAFAGG
jgi:hypothetical protein